MATHSGLDPISECDLIGPPWGAQNSDSQRKPMQFRWKWKLALVAMSAMTITYWVWFQRHEQPIVVFVHSEKGWNISRWTDEALVFKVHDDPTCTFRLLELAELTKKHFHFQEDHQSASPLSVVFASNCRRENSSFYTVRIAASIRVAVCDPEVGKICPSKVFEFDRLISRSDWIYVGQKIMDEFRRAGKSDKLLHIGSQVQSKK